MKLRLALILVPCLAGLVAISCAWRWRQAESELESRRIAAQEIEHDLARAGILRSRLGSLGSGRPSADRLLLGAQRTLVEQGLSVDAIAGIQPRGEQALAGGGLRQQAVQVNLRGLAPAQLGAWIGALRASEPAWQVGEIRLQHSAGADNRYDAGVVFAAIYTPTP